MSGRKANATKQEGGILLKSSATIENSELIGRDHIEGLTGQDVNNIIETLLKYFPRNYLFEPDALDKTLSEFRYFHEQLHEYKELHNGVNEILVSFEPFKAQIERANALRSLPKLSHLRSLWRPVSNSVDLLIAWSYSIKHIGKPFQKFDDKSMTGQDWAIQFSELKSRINNHLGLTGHALEHVPFPSKIQAIFFEKLDVEIPWWNTLNELTSTFTNASAYHMNLADKQLRLTAQKLFDLSNMALSSRLG